MFSPFERMVAWRYLRAKKAEGFVSVIAGFSFLGIMLGVATLIIVMSVMNGFRAELIGRILGLNGHITITETGGIDDYQGLSQRLAAIPNARDVIPALERQGLISDKGAATGVIVRGLSRQDLERKDVLTDGIQLGEISDFSGNKIAIGIELAKRLRLSPGSSVSLLSPQMKAGPFGSLPRSGRFEVALVYDAGMYEYNKGFIFMPLDTAQRFFGSEDKVDYIELSGPDPSNLRSLKEAVRISVPETYRVEDWQRSNASFYNALQVERNVMFLILTLIILVAAFNIISSMIMLVKDKSKDIAIMRTMGAAKGSVLRIFVLTGSLIGVAGTFFGTVLGIGFAMNIETIRRFLERFTEADLFSAEIYFLSQLPAIIEWQEVGGIVVMALILSLGATLYPAWRASRLDPVEVLRYE